MIYEKLYKLMYLIMNDLIGLSVLAMEWMARFGPASAYEQIAIGQ